MRSDYRSVLDATDKILKSASSDEAFARLVDYGESLHMSHVFAGNLSMEMTQGQLPPFFMAKMPDVWKERYLEKKYMHVDPAVQMAATMTRPFGWDECYANATGEQLKYREELKEYGCTDGIVFPMHHTIGAAGAVAFGAAMPIRFSSTVKTHLGIVSRCAYEKLEALIGPPETADIIKLTEREREILTLVAQGKTNWEVGKILDFSEYSVRDYLKDLSSRLDTSNRTHTVTRAIQLGLISP